ncbi:MAG: rRNA maturation RNase YbeY [Candidatus Thiodiazotropha sp.]
MSLSAGIEAVESLELEVQRVAESSAEIPGDEDFRRWVEAALPRTSEPVELVIRLVDEAESRRLNRDYRDRDGSTNVLSFPFEAPPEAPLPLLGDLVICVQVVAREAAEQGKEPHAHWAHMVIHGVLHLLGYDHQDDAETQQMERLEREILRALDFPDPYPDEA